MQTQTQTVVFACSYLEADTKGEWKCDHGESWGEKSEDKKNWDIEIGLREK